VAEQIGAQISIDGWAMVSAGRPALAAQPAEAAGKVSHGESVHAAVLWAAMESEAFVYLLDTGLQYIPVDSLIAGVIADVRSWVKKDKGDRLKTRQRIEDTYGYDKFLGNCHVVPNHCIMVMSLLYSNNDFSRAMEIVNTPTCRVATMLWSCPATTAISRAPPSSTSWCQVTAYSSPWASATGPTVASAVGWGARRSRSKAGGCTGRCCSGAGENFFLTPEDHTGTLFWRMHRCARILFSQSFYLCIMSARECVDLLVNRVRHERWEAGPEVRGRFAGGYPPLYRAAYLIGGLQLQALWREVPEEGRMGEKAFHDVVLRMNAVPIELLRATLLAMPMGRDYRASWRIYDEKA
jgi:hypothetical protein